MTSKSLLLNALACFCMGVLLGTALYVAMTGRCALFLCPK